MVPLPRPRLLALVLGLPLLLALVAVEHAFLLVGAAYLAVVVALVSVDLALSVRRREIVVAREMDTRLSNGVPNHIRLRLQSHASSRVRLRVRDDVPPGIMVDRRVNTVVLEPGTEAAAEYEARPRHRGTFAFGDVHLRAASALDLMERQWRVPLGREVRVYPNLVEIRRYELMVRRGLAYDAGMRRARQAGAGTVFERLREYMPDDEPRQISWTATARRGRPISVAYEVERQQRVLILLDAGRMMASTVSGLTKLDHAVNTALMLAFVANAKGDEIGFMGYADHVGSYLPPRRGKGQFQRITEELRRIEPTLTETDHQAAFTYLRARTARRSLVVLFTDLVDEEASLSLVQAVTGLAGNNLVLCVVVADPHVAEVAAARPRSGMELYEKVTAGEVLEARAAALGVMQRRGVHTLDVVSEQLTVGTIQRYLQLKQRALL